MTRQLRTVPDLVAGAVSSGLVCAVTGLEVAINSLSSYASSEATPPLRTVRSALRDHEASQQLLLVETLVQQLRNQLDNLAEGRKPAASP